MLCLHGLASFLHLNAGIPSVTTDVASMIVSYLALFNSRCTQLILGAGATRSAGLKNITTKHLALAAQALSFISNLIPHIREFVRRHAGTGTSVSITMGEFDKVRRSYLEHQQSIYDKLVDIMAGRATTLAKQMRDIDWQAQSNDSVNSYMVTLTKDTSTLHKVLTKHLPEMVVGMIMDPVFRSYKEQWGRAFGEVVLQSEDARSRFVNHGTINERAKLTCTGCSKILSISKQRLEVLIRATAWETSLSNSSRTSLYPEPQSLMLQEETQVRTTTPVQMNKTGL